MAARLTDKQKKKIIADYIEQGSYNAVAQKHKISANTVKSVVLSDEETARKCEQKKESNTIDLMNYLDEKKDIVCEIIGKGLSVLNDEKKLKAANPAQITTALGTLIDKFVSVAPQKATSNEIYRIDPLVIADGFASVRRDILNYRHTEYVLPGGRGSTKSSFFSIQGIEILKNNPQMHWLVLRQVGNTLRDSVYNQILWAIDTLGLNDEFEFKVSPLEITYKPTGQKIYFRGADDPMKIKSIKVPFGYIGILWFEELDQFKGAESVRSIEQSAIRGGDKAYIFKSFNPPKTANNWANQYIKIPKENRLVHHSTYKGVPAEWLGKVFIDEAEFLKQVNPKAYEHEYEGVPNGTGGAVFDNVVCETITDEQINNFDKIYRGVDWGWFPDPYHYGAMYYDAARLTLYIFDEYRCNKKSNRETADVLINEKKVPLNEVITCDSAEGKSIGDYKSYGLMARGAEKGPGSVDYSMKWLQSLNKIVIDPLRCPETAKEFLEYEYEKDKEGNVISGYPDANNHAIDMVRYAMSPVWKRRGN